MKFGRKPRIHDSRVPKLTAAQGLTLPIAVNYAEGMPADLSMFLNDTLGDCAEAAAGHSEQVWSFNASIGKNMRTPSDAQIESFYELCGGYVAGNPSTDQGTVLQVLLQDWLKNPLNGNEIAAFVEIDVANVQAIKETIFATGLAYIGFDVPNSLNQNPGSVWDYDPSADNSIVGGHCVILTGYQENGNFNVVSWGSASYQMTAAFLAKFCDEIYAIADSGWVQATGATPGGLTLDQLEALMASMKWAPGNPRTYRWRRRRHKHLRKKERVSAAAN